jgi:hypothetical protein
MNQNLSLSLDRADELLADMLSEQERALDGKNVSPRGVHLTHEVCERLRSVLDRVVWRYWEQLIVPSLSQSDREAVLIYFPIAKNQNGFDSALGRWRWQSVRPQHQPIYDHLLKLQPFENPASNNWLVTLSEIANSGKHVDLIPQKRTEERRVTVSSSSGSVSWGSGATFRGGVSVMGAPVDPTTQRIVPTPGVVEKIEIWVSFLIDGYNVNAADFCRRACQQTRRIVTEISDKFNLS